MLLDELNITLILMVRFVHQNSIQEIGQFKINCCEPGNVLCVCVSPLWPETSFFTPQNAYVCACIPMNGKLEEFLLNKESIIRKDCIFKLEISLLVQEPGKTARKNFTDC